MSIATEITRLQNAKADIKMAIEGKGVTVPSSTLLDGYAALIDSIQTGGGAMYSGTYTPTENTLSPIIEIGHTFDNFLIWHNGSVTGQGVKAFGGAFVQFVDGDTNGTLRIWISTNNGGTAASGYMTQNASFFKKYTSTSVRVNPNQGSGAFPGNFLANYTYNWLAW